jgi:hypothetical protein
MTPKRFVFNLIYHRNFATDYMDEHEAGRGDFLSEFGTLIFPDKSRNVQDYSCFQVNRQVDIQQAKLKI